MNTYLFVWNPKRWVWHDIEEKIQEISNYGHTFVRWSCGNTKSMAPGDRMFIVKVGTEPKGIVAEGYIESYSFLDKHWDGERKEASFIKARLNYLLNPDIDPILTLDILNTGNLTAQNWIPQASGISLKPELVDELESVWFDFLATHPLRNKPFSHKDNQSQKIYTEGSPLQMISTRYERSPYARKVCIEYYGLSCVVCSFNFEQVYGDLGKDFIHVHHLTQISNIGEQYIIDPITDLRPVCPNCHAMLHRRKEGITIEELKSKVLPKKL